MRALRHVPFALLALATCATVACTAILGSYDVGGAQPGPGQEGGPTPEGGGPTTEGGGGQDVFVPTDAPTDSPPACASPKMTCSGVCVDVTNDKDNCGSCGRSCLGGGCTASVCGAFLAYGRADVSVKTLIATDTDLFFGITTKDVIQQPVAPGATSIRLAATSGLVFDIAPAPPKVYFTAQNSDGTWDYWTGMIGTVGSATAAGFSLGGTPVGLVAAGGLVHAQNALPGSPASFRITSCPPPNGPCSANYTGAGIPGSRMAAGGGNIFWTDQLGSVFAMPDGIGSRTPLSPIGTEGTATGANFDGTTLFWVQNNNSRIRKSVYPTPNPMDVRGITSSAEDMIVDGTNIYYSQFNGGSEQLFFMPKSGAVAPTALAAGNMTRLAQTATGIYWAESDGIHVIRKP